MHRSGQQNAWVAHHRRLCKHLPRFIASHDYTSSSEAIQLQAILLSKLVVEHLGDTPSSSNPPKPSESMEALLSLLPHPHRSPEPPIPQVVQAIAAPHGENGSLVEAFSARFMNNHWMIYSSELDAIAHGVYPVASRSFNHSCLPNAVPVFYFRENTGPLMEIMALTDLASEVEV